MRAVTFKYPLVRRFMGIFVGTIVLCLLVNFGMIAVWTMHMDASSHRITIGRVERGYELTLPPQAAQGPVPLVIFLHGRSQTARIVKYRIGFDEAAEKYGFAVAYPNGIGQAWTVLPPSLAEKYPETADSIADMDFIDALVDDLVARKIADEHRVYLSGLSNGGQLTYLMACVRPGKFAAMAPLISTITQLVSQECKAASPMPMLIQAGTDDKYVYWNGKKDGAAIDNFLSVKDSVNFWKHANGCSDVAVKRNFPHLYAEDTTSAAVETWSNCTSGKNVALYEIKGGGHQPPSITGDDLWSPFLGPRNHDIDIGAEAWKFFKEYRK